MITHYKNISNTPAMRLAVKAWAELVERDLTGDECMVQWDHQALVYSQNGIAIGVLTFIKAEYRFAYEIALGWVHPDHRMQGIYNQLFQALLARAKTDGVRIIEGSTHINNIAMVHVAANQHRQFRGTLFRYTIEQETVPPAGDAA